MSWEQQWLEQPILWRTGWTLIHFLWQGGLILLLVRLALALGRRAAPARRYWVMVLGLGVMAASPALTFFYLHEPSRTEFLEAHLDLPPALGPNAARYSAQPEPVVADENARENPTAAVELSTSPRDAVAARSPAAPGSNESVGSRFRELVDRGVPWVVVCWGLGVMALSMRLLAGWWTAHALRRDRVGRPPNAILLQWKELCTRLGARADSIALLESARVRAPVVIGWLRPAILLPVGLATGLTAAEVNAVLAHELAHIRRADFLVNLLQSVVEVVLFFHPAVWLLSGWIRDEREVCCDEWALAAVGDRVGYARALAKLAESAQPCAAVSASGGDLTKRVRRILQQPADGEAASASLFSVVLVIGLAAVALGVLRFDSAGELHAQATGESAQPASSPESELAFQVDERGDISVRIENAAWRPLLAKAFEVAQYKLHIQEEPSGRFSHISGRAYSKNELIRFLRLELLKRGCSLEYSKERERFEVLDAAESAQQKRQQLLAGDAPLADEFKLLDYRVPITGESAPARVYRFQARRDMNGAELVKLFDGEFDDLSFRRWSDGERVIVDGYRVRQQGKLVDKEPTALAAGQEIEVWVNPGYGWNEREMWPKRTLVAGRVEDAGGRPIVGATVDVHYTEGLRLGGNYGQTVTSDGEGRFEVRIAQRHFARMKEVRVSASAPGFAPRRLSSMELSEEEVLDDLVVKLGVGQMAKLRFVSTKSGEEVRAGYARVHQLGVQHAPRFSGAFRGPIPLLRLSKDSLRIIVRAPGYEEAHFNNVAIEDRSVTLPLRPTKPAQFRLVSAVTGMRLANQEVRFFNRAHADSTVRPVPSKRDRAEVWAKSDATGRVLLPFLRGADHENPTRAHYAYWFYVAPRGHSPVYIGPITAGQDLGVIRVGPTQRVTVKVHVPEGAKTPVRVEWDQPLRQSEGARNASITKTLDSIKKPGDYEYRLDNLRRGRFRVIARYGRGSAAFGYAYGQRVPSADDVVVEIPDLRAPAAVVVKPEGGEATQGDKTAERRRMLDALQQLNSPRNVDPDVLARIKMFEEAFRIQTELGEIDWEQWTKRERQKSLRGVVESLREELTRIDDDKTVDAYQRVIRHLDRELQK